MSYQWSFTTGIGAACHPNDSPNVAWWSAGGRTQEEKNAKEIHFGKTHLQPPDWTSDVDLFVHAHPHCRLGRRCPLTNNSTQVAKLLHPGVDENFPAHDAPIEEYPGYPFNMLPEDRERSKTRDQVAALAFQPWDKPLIKAPMDDAASTPSLKKSASMPGSVVSMNTSCVSTNVSVPFSKASHLSLPHSKLAVGPYFYGQIPGSRWYHESKRLLKRREELCKCP